VGRRLGISVATLVVVEQRQIVERLCNVRMIGTERLLPDRQRWLVERLGIGVTTLIGVKQSQIVEGCRNVRLVGTERLLADRQDALRQRHSFSEFPGSIQCRYSSFQCGHLAVPELAFVNCCYLGRIDPGSTMKASPLGDRRPLFAANVAEQLIRNGVRCVMAAGWAVDDGPAKLFATTTCIGFLPSEADCFGKGSSTRQRLVKEERNSIRADIGRSRRALRRQRVEVGVDQDLLLREIGDQHVVAVVEAIDVQALTRSRLQCPSSLAAPAG
jgi:hypothetical protein